MSRLSKKPAALHILFSVYAWLAACVFLPLFFVFFMLSLLMGYQKGYQLIRYFYVMLYLLWSPIRVSYHPDFDPNTPYVLVQNHVNLLDGFLTGRISQNPICGLMHAWQFKIPFYGWIMRLSRGIPVDPKRRGNLQKIVREASLRKKEGLSIITFPEGGRTLDGNLKPFKKGVFVMAQQAELDVVPVTVKGIYHINQKGSYLFWPHPVSVVVGKPRSLKDVDRESLQDFISELQDHMQSVLK